MKSFLRFNFLALISYLKVSLGNIQETRKSNCHLEIIKTILTQNNFKKVYFQTNARLNERLRKSWLAVFANMQVYRGGGI